MSIRKQRFVEGFVKTCQNFGITDETDILELLKEAVAPDKLMGEEAANMDDEEYYRASGKLICPTCGQKIDRDAHGLPGDQERTNVSSASDYAI